MKNSFATVLTLTAASALWLHAPRVSAQDAPPPPPPPPAEAAAQGAPGAPGGPGGDFRARMAERIKTQLKATDEEWSVIQPLLEKVETKTRESMGGRYGGLMGGGGRPQRRDDSGNGGQGGGQRAQRENGAAGGGPRPERAGGGRGGSPEAQALTETLKNDGASSEEIKTKLAAVREQRKKTAAELAAAREDLKKVLNMRQEATLVAMGILD